MVTPDLTLEHFDVMRWKDFHTREHWLELLARQTNPATVWAELRVHEDDIDQALEQLHIGYAPTPDHPGTVSWAWGLDHPDAEGMVLCRAGLRMRWRDSWSRRTSEQYLFDAGMVNSRIIEPLLSTGARFRLVALRVHRKVLTPRQPILRREKIEPAPTRPGGRA